MNTDLTFRRAGATDFEAVLDLASQLAFHVKSTAPSLTAADFDAYYLRPLAPMHLLLALRQDRVVGMISWTMTHELNTAEVRVYISDLAVYRTARGQGVGTGLVLEVKAWALAHRAQKLGWEVWHRNISAKAFYQGLGASVDHEAVPYVMRLEQHH